MKPTVLIIVTAMTLGLTQPAKAQELNGEHLLWGLVALAFAATAIDALEDNTSSNGTTVAPPPPPKVLPAHCLRRHKTNKGNVRLMGNRCLKRHSAHFQSLPERCFVRVRNTENKRRKGFRPKCLRNAGYKIR